VGTFCETQCRWLWKTTWLRNHTSDAGGPAVQFIIVLFSDCHFQIHILNNF